MKGKNDPTDIPEKFTTFVNKTGPCLALKIQNCFLNLKFGCSLDLPQYEFRPVTTQEINKTFHEMSSVKATSCYRIPMKFIK